MIRAPNLTVAVFLALAPPAAAAKISLIVADAEQARAARAGPGVSVVTFDLDNLSDPIKKGRFLASLQASDRVISATRGKACGWLVREVEGVPVQCLMPYDARQVLDFARSARWRRVAAVHMTGYEKVYARLRALAGARGIELVAVRVDTIRDLPQTLHGALKTVSAVWILGDPLLTEGPAFEHLVETTLARKIPLVGPGVDLVARGVFLGADSDHAAMTRYAAGLADAAAKGAPADEDAAEVPGGRLLVNEVLARRWGVAVSGRPR